MIVSAYERAPSEVRYNAHIKRAGSHKLENDQNKVFEGYFAGSGRACVDAGAGTGKTTTLVEVLAEAVICEAEKGVRNPLERILVVTFGVEAARKIKTDLKKRLMDHKAAGGTLPKDIMRLIESESAISTLDSLQHSLFKEIAPAIGLTPAFDLPSVFDEDEITKEAMAEMRKDAQLDNKLNFLQALYPEFQYQEFGKRESLMDILKNARKKMREFCFTPEEAENRIKSAVERLLHFGKKPPFTRADVESIVEKAKGGEYRIECDNRAEKKMIGYVEGVFCDVSKAYDAFANVLRAFDRIYDAICRKKGLFSYNDISYMIWQFSRTDEGRDWGLDLQGRYDHILVDEFQDTSHVQFEIIKLFLRGGSKGERNRVMLIGDVKQSIYQWRSAEPDIFMEILKNVNGKMPLSHMRLEGMEYFPLVSNFRSHEELIHFFNGMFSKMFSDKATGAIKGNVVYNPLRAAHVGPKSACEVAGPRLHVMKLDNGGKGFKNQDEWLEKEPDAIASTIDGLIDAGVHAGDIVLLFRRKTHIPKFVRKLRERGIFCIVMADNSLFGEPEVSVMIDFLNWLENPESRESITRILRSPLVALSDESMRFVASREYMLTVALSEWDDSLPKEDKERIADLLALRHDLRWDREGSKTELIQRIISHSSFDSVVLTTADGLQSYANLWMFQEVVSSWEEDELLPYREFVKKLNEYRTLAREEKEGEYPRAQLADERSRTAVRITTIHKAKGLEFPIVFLPDAFWSCDTTVARTTFVDRSVGVLLSPKTRAVQPQEMKITNNSGEYKLPWVGDNDNGSILWARYARDKNGCVPSPTEMQKVQLSAVAESWRLLYVSLTRAKEHLILPYGNYSASQYNRNNTWMLYLAEYINKIDMKTKTLTLDWAEDGKTIKRTIPVGINDLPTKIKGALENIPYSGLGMGSASAFSPGYSNFVPKKLTPSTFSDIIECPMRYQYSRLWQMDGVRSGDKGCVAMLSDEWGRLVHSAMEQRNFAKRLHDDSDLIALLDEQREGIIPDLKKAIDNFDTTSVGVGVRNAAIAGRPVRREEKIYCHIEDPRKVHPHIILSGRYDLLFQDEKGEWCLVDFKTEPQKDEGSYRDLHYKAQIKAYCWALKKTEGIVVKHGCIAYLFPKPGVTLFDPWHDGFESMVGALWEIKFDDKGLIARPGKDRCETCPYRNSNKGPCEHG